MEKQLQPIQSKLNDESTVDATSAGYKYETCHDDEAVDDCDFDAIGEGIDYTNNDEANVGSPPCAIYTTVLTKNSERKRIPFVYVLGKKYHPVDDSRKEYERSLFWFTYRHGFPELKPYGITTDAGWGCMLRSAQMMLAHTLRIHFKSRHWKCNVKQAQKDDFVNKVLTWFADYPSKTDSFYSLHNMCAAGLSNYEVLPGEWYGPGTACYVLRDLVTLHQGQQSNLFRVHVAQGTVYRSAINDLMTTQAKRRAQDRERKEAELPIEPLHPLDPAVISSIGPDYSTLEWDTSLLLLIPLRLGLDNFNSDYVKSVARTFSLPQSVGILGGRPRGARWFYGAYADGSKVFGLDPHTVQAAPQKEAGELDISDDLIASVFTSFIENIDLVRMDPSIALGFYCRNRKDFESLEESLKHLNDDSSSPELVAFLENVPDYLSSSSVNDVMFNDDMLDQGGSCNEDNDEEDYVLL